MHLRVDLLEGGVGHALLLRPAAGDLEHPRRQVDTDRRTFGRGAGRVASRLPGAAADVEDPIRGGDVRGGQQPLVVGGDGAVEVLGVLRPVGALIAVPGPELVGIGRVDLQCAGARHGILLRTTLSHWE